MAKPDTRVVKPADKSIGDSRGLKLHGSGYQRGHFTARGNLRRMSEKPNGSKRP